MDWPERGGGERERAEVEWEVGDSLEVLKGLLIQAPYLFHLCTLNPWARVRSLERLSNLTAHPPNSLMSSVNTPGSLSTRHQSPADIPAVGAHYLEKHPATIVPSKYACARINCGRCCEVSQRAMKYRSTRGGAEGASFSEVLLSSYAPDGGLYVPETLPRIGREQLRAWTALDYPQLLLEILSLFVSPEELSPQEMKS